MGNAGTLDRSLAGFEEKAAEAAAMLKALGNEKRLMILCKLLEHGEMSVMALIGQVGLSASPPSPSTSPACARRRSWIRGATPSRSSTAWPTRGCASILSTLKTVYC